MEAAYEIKEDERGYFVYVNKDSGAVLNDNPNVTSIVMRINHRFAAYRYSTYRSACKLYALRQLLHTSRIPFHTVSTILDRHRLTRSASASSVKPRQVAAAIYDLYFSANRMGCLGKIRPQSISGLSGTFASVVCAVLAPRNARPLCSVELRLILLLLCEHTTDEQMMRDHFRLAMDHNLCVSRYGFDAMLTVLSKVLAFLGEADYLPPTLVHDIVSECFEQYPGLIGLTEYHFGCLWNLTSGMRSYCNVVSLTTRLSATEDVCHRRPCTACGTAIRGLRFKCQWCRKLSLCIDCFSQGYTSKRHKLQHRMYEISSNSSDSRDAKGNRQQTQGTLVRYFANAIGAACGLRSGRAGSDTTIHRRQSTKSPERRSIEIEQIDEEEAQPPAPYDGDRTRSTSAGTLSRANYSTGQRPNASVFSGLECGIFGDGSPSGGLLGHLTGVADALDDETGHFRVKLANWRTTDVAASLRTELDGHVDRLSEQAAQLRQLCAKIGRSVVAPQSSSTPYRNRLAIEPPPLQPRRQQQQQMELSVRDISSWFHVERPSGGGVPVARGQRSQNDLGRTFDRLQADTQMANFRDLLLKVREIVDDSYSDNTELARTTQQLETALGRIIEDEERKRHHHQQQQQQQQQLL